MDTSFTHLLINRNRNYPKAVMAGERPRCAASPEVAGCRVACGHSIPVDRHALVVLAALLERQPPPAQVSALQVYMEDEALERVELHGFVAEQHVWTGDASTYLPFFRALANASWDEHDSPWQWALLAGCFALAVGRVVDSMSGAFLGGVAEREIATCFGCSGEHVLLGVLRPGGMTYLDRREIADTDADR
jgi:hypothetical protein